MGCRSCGGGSRSRSGGSGAAGVSRGVSPRTTASRKGALKWVHTSLSGSRTRYATQGEAEAAKRLIGGTVQEDS